MQMAMFIYYLWLVLLHFTVYSSAQGSCTSNSTILTEQDLKQFLQCQSVSGDLIIGDCSSREACSITEFELNDNLNTVELITGDFIVQCCDQLTSIRAPSLGEIRGTLRIFNNNQLLNLASGLNTLSKVGNIKIYQNPSLISISGFGTLQLVNGYISIGNNAKLQRITGFSALVRIVGQNLTNDHGLAIVYNPLLTDISGFHSLVSIAFGTVHIEGNTLLCYAGYPLWSYGGYSNRYTTGDKGIDWRSVLDSSLQFTWDTTTGIVPSLVIQNNGNQTYCASTSCSETCTEGAGCFGPGEDSSLCGKCYLTDGLNTCDEISFPEDEGSSCPGWWPPTSEPFTTLFALVMAFGIVMLVMIGIIVCLVVYKVRQCVSGEKQGSYAVGSDKHSSMERDYRSGRGLHSNYADRTSPPVSKERTVLGRGAGSSASNSPAIKQQDYLYSVPNKKSRLGHQEGSMSSTPSSPAELGGGIVKIGETSEPVKYSVPSLGEGYLASNAVAGNGDRGSDTHPTSVVSNHYASHSPVEQFKDPLKSSEIALKSIHNRESPKPTAAITTTAEVYQQHDWSPTVGTFHRDTPPNQRHLQPPWEELSDVGQGMRHQLRDEVWSEENNSFDDDDEEFDGHQQQQHEELNNREEAVEEELYEFPSLNIRLDKQIGKGSFGKVFEADAYAILGIEEWTRVVVKQSNDHASREELKIFLQPAYAMKELKHENVLSLLAVSRDSPNTMIILEYCSNGCLKTFLKNQKKNAMKLKQEGTVHQILLDIAMGVSYFHSVGIAYNDLSSRNCLVTRDIRIKVGDYGYSRTAFRDDYYSRTPGQTSWPFRWMSPEMVIDNGDGVLDSQQATETSNVWSYGIVMWEVCSFGEHPYPKMTEEQVIQALQTTQHCNMANPVPPNDPLYSFHELMKMCWKPEGDRVSMIEIYYRVSQAKEEFVPVKYSGRPLRTAPKKPEPAPKPQLTKQSTITGVATKDTPSTVSFTAPPPPSSTPPPSSATLPQPSTTSTTAPPPPNTASTTAPPPPPPPPPLPSSSTSVPTSSTTTQHPPDTLPDKQQVLKRKDTPNQLPPSPVATTQPQLPSLNKVQEKQPSEPSPKKSSGKRKKSERRKSKKSSKIAEPKESPKPVKQEEPVIDPNLPPHQRDSWSELDEGMFTIEDIPIVPPPPSHPTNDQPEQGSSGFLKTSLGDELPSRRRSTRRKNKYKAKEDNKLEEGPVSSSKDQPPPAPAIPPTVQKQGEKETVTLAAPPPPAPPPPKVKDTRPTQVEDEQLEQLGMSNGEVSRVNPLLQAASEPVEDEQLEQLGTNKGEVSRVNPLLQAMTQQDELTSLSEDDDSDTDIMPHPPSEGYKNDYVTRFTSSPMESSDTVTNNAFSSQQYDDGSDNDSWDEFDAGDTSADKLANPSQAADPQRRESFMLPPDSPDATPPLSRKPSYVTPPDLDGLQELDEDDTDAATEEDDVPPPPRPASLPPPDESDESSENSRDKSTSDPSSKIPDPSSKIPDPSSKVPDPPSAISDPPPVASDSPLITPKPPSASVSNPPSKVSEPSSRVPDPQQSPSTTPDPSSRPSSTSTRKPKKAAPPPPANTGSKSKRKPIKREPTEDEDDLEVELPVKLDFLPVQSEPTHSAPSPKPQTTTTTTTTTTTPQEIKEQQEMEGEPEKKKGRTWKSFRKGGSKKQKSEKKNAADQTSLW